MYEYAAGDLRGVTTEMVRAASPEHARKLCVALGVPEEHVQTWAVRCAAEEHEAKVKDLRELISAAEQDASDARSEYRWLEREHQEDANNARTLERRRSELSLAVDTACELLRKIDLDAEVLDDADADCIRKALEALSAV